LQVIAAYGALTNGGRLISPHLVQRIGTHSEAPRPVVASKAVRGDIADWTTRQALTEVVVRGTGRKAQLKGYSVFGKSGTAQKPDPVTGKYSNRLHVSSFICGAPADKPEVLVLVTVDEPSVGADHYGGTIAAPAAAEILEKALAQLRIPPKDGTIRAALRQH
jgi:cell division protein FtsI/penicillin-binding protein 2